MIMHPYTLKKKMMHVMHPEQRAQIQVYSRFILCSSITLNYIICTGAEDDQFEEEKELIIKEIERTSRLVELRP